MFTFRCFFFFRANRLDSTGVYRPKSFRVNRLDRTSVYFQMDNSLDRTDVYFPIKFRVNRLDHVGVYFPNGCQSEQTGTCCVWEVGGGRRE